MKAKRAHPPKAQTPPKDRLFLSQSMILSFKKEKIPLKSNKKRRLGTISCILFCVLIWCGRRDLKPIIKTLEVFKIKASSVFCPNPVPTK